MNEYCLFKSVTGERKIIFGYNYEDACRRAQINPPLGPEWEVEYTEYVD